MTRQELNTKMAVVYIHQSPGYDRVEIFADVVWATPCLKCGGKPVPKGGWSMSCVYSAGTNNQHDQGLTASEKKTVLTGDAARQYIAAQSV